MNKTITNQKGFTLIEIIAVLIILGVLAAVAVPKYVNMAAEAKRAAGQGQVAELKSSLNLAYSKLYMSNGAAPGTAADIISTVGGSSTVQTIGVAPDIWSYTMAASGTTGVKVEVTKRGDDADYAASGQWNIPQ